MIVTFFSQTQDLLHHLFLFPMNDDHQPDRLKSQKHESLMPYFFIKPQLINPFNRWHFFRVAIYIRSNFNHQ